MTKESTKEKYTCWQYAKSDILRAIYEQFDILNFIYFSGNYVLAIFVADGIFTVVILTVEFCTVFLFTVGILTVGNCTVLLGGICTAGILTVGNCTVVLGGNCTAGTYTVGICTVGISSTKYLTSKDLWKIRKKDEKVFASDRARTSIIKAVTICLQFPCLYQLRHGGYCYRNGQSLII